MGWKKEAGRVGGNEGVDDVMSHGPRPMKPAKGGSDWRNESAPVRNAESGATLPAKTGINRDTREAVHLQLQPPLNNDHQSPPSAGFRWLPLASGSKSTARGVAAS